MLETSDFSKGNKLVEALGQLIARYRLRFGTVEQKSGQDFNLLFFHAMKH